MLVESQEDDVLEELAIGKFLRKRIPSYPHSVAGQGMQVYILRRYFRS